MPVRLRDIAEQLNVSVATVSKVLRGYKDVNPATREKVLAKVRELNYTPNWAARSLVSRRSFTIGMVVPHLRHTFFQEAYRAISRQTAPEGYTVLIANSLEDPAAEEKEIDLMLARQVDGLIIASALPPSSPGHLPRLGERKVPFVLIDRRFENLEANFVGVDDCVLGHLATTHLIDQGCRRIAHIRGPEVSTALGRLQGYQAALKDHGLPCPSSLVGGGSGDDETGYREMLRMLESPKRPDGVFCYNDPVAAGAMKALLESGLRVPDDVALIGAGNMHYCDLFRVPLSTIDQNSYEVGTQAARLLAELIGKPGLQKPRDIILPS
ncbi:MAG: LacI family transcriptional regulator, partial [bacterium]|nr:LacI family transcriptional regulator [bacterium]